MKPIGHEAVNRLTPLPVLLSADVDLSAEHLIRKFGRSERPSQDIVYELTQDAGYLHQYYLLREDLFARIFGARKENCDEKSDIMIARIGNHCIGGCRLTFSEPGRRELLPMERGGFILERALPELKLAKEAYVEISRMAVLPEFQNSVVMLELSRQLLKRAAQKKARYAFTLTPVTMAYSYRKAAHLLGLEWKIRDDIAVPDREEYEGVKMVLSQLDLAPIYRRKVKGGALSQVADLAEM